MTAAPAIIIITIIIVISGWYISNINNQLFASFQN